MTQIETTNISLTANCIYEKSLDDIAPTPTIQSISLTDGTVKSTESLSDLESDLEDYKEYNYEFTNTVISCIIALLLPPLAVFLERGAGKDLLINIVLCCFAWFPGILHALYVVLATR